MAVKATTKEIFNAIKQHEIAGEKVTAADIAEETGLSVRQVNGVFTMCIDVKGQNKYGFREPAKVKMSDDTEKEVKFLRMNEDGLAHALEAAPAE